jgi:hypothetical protein
MEDRRSGKYSVARIAAKEGKKLSKRRIPCLKCGRSFASEGPHNRLCEVCRGVATGRTGYVDEFGMGVRD